VLVAAQRDMVERLLAAARGAGLTPVGVDLSAFALIRSLWSAGGPDNERVLYLNVDGLTNLAIAEGDVCRFTRVVGGGVEAMAAELATRRAIPLAQARALLATVDLGAAPVEPGVALAGEPSSAPAAPPALDLPGGGSAPTAEAAQAVEADAPVGDDERQATVSREEHDAREASMAFAEAVQPAQGSEPEPASEPALSDADIRSVLENGVRELTDEIRNSLDFHRAQDHGAEISYLSLSGAALDLPGFPQALQSSLGLEVRNEAVGLLDTTLEGEISTNRLSIAAGLATVEVPR
jgi:Tfp pilus assembly PilM family ATPase